MGETGEEKVKGFSTARNRQKKRKQVKPLPHKTSTNKEMYEKEVVDRGKYNRKGKEYGKSQELGNPHRYFCI